MGSEFTRIYERLVLARPWTALVVTLAVVGCFAWQIPKFQLDASGDSLVLERDHDLRYFRRIIERYGTQDVLVLTYSPQAEIFSAPVLADIKSLRDELKTLDDVDSVTSILDVPLIYNSGLSLEDLREVQEIMTLEEKESDPAKAAAEFHDNPLYHGRLLSDDGKTTAILLNLPIDETYRNLLNRRYKLREKKYDNLLSPDEAEQLSEVERQYRQHLTLLTEQERILVEAVRSIIERHRHKAQIHLGGLPMIVVDMISFIQNDLVVFGLGVCIFLIITLGLIFRKVRWVLLPMTCCAVAVITVMGYLGMMDWRVTVISSNFISLMIILTMSLTIHLIERYLEVHAAMPEADKRTLVLETVRTIVLPCLYTTLTTMVAFTSLVVSDIRPVIDFGMMMAIGLVVSFTLAFILFPATIMLLPKGENGIAEDFSNPFTLIFARFTERHGHIILLVSLGLAILSGLGITKLRVENRFIDYFREKTEIFQGLSLIDRQLGGTTPLDLIIDFPQEQPEEDDEFDDDFGEEESVSYWFADLYTMEQLEKVHDHLVSLPETGEVLSLATAGKIARKLNNNEALENFELTLLYKKSPPEIKELIMHPYVSEDIRQARFTMRIVESDKNLERTALLGRVEKFLTEKMGFAPEQIHFTSMYVLYNNMLQSLFHSQILTIGMVFGGIMVMFTILFRSFALALVASVPNMLPVAVVLGTMGWFNISLDMMTITIASITIGIAVDDTIHYIHRFQREFPKDRNYLATIYRCHASIGRAMYYTSITITIGFSILVLSNFIPTIYFGLFTGFAMLVALLADLTLLPKLLLFFKPLGPEAK